MKYGLSALVCFAIVAILVPILRKYAIRFGFVDRPNARKIHKAPVPLMGGAALYFGVVVTLFMFQGITPLSLTICIGGFILVVIGLIDDASKSRGADFPVWPRVIAYMAVAAIPLLFDIEIEGLSSPHGMIIFPHWLGIVSSIIWVFALINMINFIDGVDGLASGVSTLSSLTLFIAALFKQQYPTALLAVILVAACAAFLFYNFYPARIFMGDAGATFLGYALAVTAVDGAFKSATLVTVAVPFLALGVPILDTAIVMLRRLLSGKGLHRADKLHTHHVLMKWGLTQIQTVSFIYLVAALFSLLSLVLLLALS
ncbi:undecaprenyl/decaprenyl-phosphate alpha-N-acetylglucosaminyl 1-phosphate transferase [Paenibacillus rhizovicinus]|uniref:Undecaprenyl/decaprenyl-phosphate alpha-N-acetylglucosaminyl 1-phosphate transferase n=1 Tax=Paenibacillus rhizovicinus TaxID=2704463 RepID=A0A6C0P0B4_9BACL|nr:MraY family glycosyltransferase [Paenibacillus rhizovicinus]QHW31970.1 undecaprenyl/decaprenyl-phosphate alpha-N-acetylglucosaminyl 1-phosphate transferase [Paenibacillus rhizovicinus]